MQPQDNSSVDNNQFTQPASVPHEPVLGGEVVDATPVSNTAPVQSDLGVSATSGATQTDAPVDIYASLPDTDAPSEADVASTSTGVEAPAATDYSSPVAPVEVPAIPVATPAYPVDAPAPVVTPAYPAETQTAGSTAPSLEVPAYPNEPAAAAPAPVQSSEVAPDVPEGPLPPLSTGGPVVG